MSDCSIIIRTLNEGRYLGQLLEGIRAQEYSQSEIEIIVVDSGSTDDTLAIAEKGGCRILHLKRSEFSFGRSLNIGCDAANGKYLVFISGHCVPVDKHWLSNLLQPFSDPNTAISFGRQVGGAETRFSEHSLFAKYFPEHPEHNQPPFFCNNANLALRSECWKEHRFDESLTGLEDMYIAKQLWQQKRKIVYAPSASVYHYHHESWGQVRRRYERESLALREIMPEVHVQWHDAVRYFSAGVLSDLSDALQQRVFLSKAFQIVAFRFCQFYGAWRGNHLHRNLSRQRKERYFYPR